MTKWSYLIFIRNATQSCTVKPRAKAFTPPTFEFPVATPGPGCSKAD